MIRDWRAESSAVVTEAKEDRSDHDALKRLFTMSVTLVGDRLRSSDRERID